MPFMWTKFKKKWSYILIFIRCLHFFKISAFIKKVFLFQREILEVENVQDDFIQISFRDFFYTSFRRQKVHISDTSISWFGRRARIKPSVQRSKRWPDIEQGRAGWTRKMTSGQSVLWRDGHLVLSHGKTHAQTLTRTSFAAFRFTYIRPCSQKIEPTKKD